MVKQESFRIYEDKHECVVKKYLKMPVGPFLGIINN
jgi:hypothetical protein